MRELQWNFNNNNIHTQQLQQTEMTERQSVEEPWLRSEFSQLTRKQQNCEIYRVSKTLSNKQDFTELICQTRFLQNSYVF